MIKAKITSIRDLDKYISSRCYSFLRRYGLPAQELADMKQQVALELCKPIYTPKFIKSSPAYIKQMVFSVLYQFSQRRIQNGNNSSGSLETYYNQDIDKPVRLPKQLITSHPGDAVGAFIDVSNVLESVHLTAKELQTVEVLLQQGYIPCRSGMDQSFRTAIYKMRKVLKLDPLLPINIPREPTDSLTPAQRKEFLEAFVKPLRTKLQQYRHDYGNKLIKNKLLKGK